MILGSCERSPVIGAGATGAPRGTRVARRAPHLPLAGREAV